MLHCDMATDCAASVTHIDNKGYVYCAKHGVRRKASGVPCRQLQPTEKQKLESGETVSYERAARLDADRTAQPKTRLVGHAPAGSRVGPGLVPDADAIEDIATGARTPLAPVPTLAHVLSTFAYHVAGIMTERPTRSDAPYAQCARFGLGLGGYGPGCPTVHVQIEITPVYSEGDPDRWGVWAHVSIDGKACGNRCGGRDEYARLCAPVIAWVAAHAQA